MEALHLLEFVLLFRLFRRIFTITDHVEAILLGQIQRLPHFGVVQPGGLQSKSNQCLALFVGQSAGRSTFRENTNMIQILKELKIFKCIACLKGPFLFRLKGTSASQISLLIGAVSPRPFIKVPL